MSEGRQTRLVSFVGKEGSGKSTYIANAIKAYPRNVIVYKDLLNINDKAMQFLSEKSTTNWRQGVAPGAAAKCKIAGDDRGYKDFLNWVKNNFRNGLLVIDDTGIYERYKTTPELYYLIKMRRHLGIDIWLVFHGFSEVILDTYKSSNMFIVFNTSDQPEYKKNMIPRYDDIMTAAEIAKSRYASLPPGKPERYKPETVILSL